MADSRRFAQFTARGKMAGSKRSNKLGDEVFITGDTLYLIGPTYQGRVTERSFAGALLLDCGNLEIGDSFLDFLYHE